VVGLGSRDELPVTDDANIDKWGEEDFGAVARIECHIS
jgi:hypothetical protein